MRVYSQYLPFLNKSRTVGLRQGSIPADKILNINNPENYQEIVESFLRICKFMKIPFYYERNLDVYIPQCRTRLDYYAVMMMVNGDLEAKGKITEIDYSDVANNLEIEVENSNNDMREGSTLAVLNVANGEFVEDIVTDLFINSAANRVKVNLHDLQSDDSEKVNVIFTESIVLNINKCDMSSLREAFALDSSANVDRSPNSIEAEQQDAYEEYLENYLTSEKLLTKNRVPLLVGTTAVAKSSLVKSLVQRLDTGDANGYRLIDFRAAFIDKNDIEGFSTKIKDANNEYYSEMSPMRELLEATDEYLSYARSTLMGITQKLSVLLNQGEEDRIEELRKQTQRGTDEEKSEARKELREILEKLDNSKEIRSLLELKRLYTEKSKKPILFFDEVTRAPKEARNAFTTILNQKKFLNYNMKEARIVAATNYPVGMPEDYAMVYTTEEINDIAALERYESFVVKPEDVFPRWLKWATANLEESVVKFIKEGTNPKDRAYALDTVMQTVDDSDGELDPYNAAEIPFPNYRTWEFVSKYIAGIQEHSQPFDIKMVEALIGKNRVSREFESYMKKNYKTLTDMVPPDERDWFEDSLYSGVVSGVPVLLSGPTSYGKTTRVKNIADKLDAVLIEVNLATKDATQIKGTPTPVPVEDTVLYGSTIDIESLPADIKSLLRDTRSHGVSGNTTDYMPDKYIRDLLMEAKESGRMVILFFDEVNRCDKTVLSSVFEAVSDDRFMGVQFQKGQVRVVAAANLGNQYGDVEMIDPAFAARFAMVRKDQWDLDDVRSFKNYINSDDHHGNPRYAEPVKNFITNQPDDVLLEMLQRVEERTLINAVPSMRAWDDISQMIMNSEGNNPFVGKVVFLISTPEGEYLDRVSKNTSVQNVRDADIKKSLDTIQRFPQNWVGLLSNPRVTIRGLGSYTISDLLDGAAQICKFIDTNGTSHKDAETFWQQFRAIISAFKSVEENILKNRRTMIEAKLGSGDSYDIVERFFEFYNTVSGEKIIILRDLVDKSLIKGYVRLKTNGLSPDEIIAACSDFIGEFYNEFRVSLSVDHYQEVINACHEVLQYQDPMLDWWKSVIKDKRFVEVVTRASENSMKFTYDILNVLGVPSNNYKDVIEEYYA